MFKKRKLGLALAAVMAGGLLSSGTQAVSLTPDGLGDAALFQYYTANQNWQTFFRLVNTSDNALAVKVRFREAANSREVLDFVVALSPYDMWHAWTDKDALRDGGGPGIRTNDTSCVFPAADTNPDPAEGWQTIDGDLKGARFKDRAFTGVYDDNAGMSSLARMSEGHIEVIGIAQYEPNSSSSRERQFAAAVTHIAGGYPNACAEAEGLLAADAASGDDMDNALAANAYLINVAGGLGAGYDPTMLYDFTDQPLELETAMSDTTPDLDSAEPGAYGWPNGGPSGISQDNFAVNQTRGVDGAYLGYGVQTVVDGYRADIDGDGITTSTVSIDLNQDGSGCDSINEMLVTPAQWMYLEGAYTAVDPNGICDRAIVAADNGDVTTGPVVLVEVIDHQETGFFPARFKQLGQAGVWPVTGGVDAVSALLMRSSVINEWAAKYNPGSAISDNYTQWVINFPTKHYYVDLMDDPNPYDDVSPMLVDPDGPGGYSDNTDGDADGNDAWAPFAQEFDDGNQPGTSCEPYHMRIWNREEREVQFTSPAPYAPAALCYETNVLTFNERYNTAGLNSNFAINVPSTLLPTDWDGDLSTQGWARLQFTGLGTQWYMYHDGDARSRGWHGHTGLPVDGFMMTVFNTNSTANNHAMINSHKYERDLVEGDCVVPERCDSPQ